MALNHVNGLHIIVGLCKQTLLNVSKSLLNVIKCVTCMNVTKKAMIVNTQVNTITTMIVQLHNIEVTISVNSVILHQFF